MTVVEELWQVTASHFCCGITTRHDRIVSAAPILGWTVDKHMYWFMGYCKSKGWKLVKVATA